MSDVNANININIDSSEALAEIKRLQREISLFYTSINKGSATAAAAAQNMQRNLVNSINATGAFEARIVGIQTASESFTTALEKNKLTMGQYFRYAGGATKTFGKLFSTEMNTIEKTAIDRVRKLQTQYIKLGRDAQGAMKAIAVTPNMVDLNNYTTRLMVSAQKQQIFNELLKQGSTQLLNFGKNTQWAGRQLMVGFTVPLSMMGSVAVKSFMEIEKAAVKFRRVYGDLMTSPVETETALTDIRLLAQEFTKYGVAIVDTMNMAAEAAAMGKQGAELTAQVAQATRLAVLGQVEQSEALQTTITLTNAFGVAAQDLATDINFLNAVENQTITAIEDLTIAVPKAGPVVKQLGGDVRDLAFFLTAMKEGGINASEGANALKSGLASLINPTKTASDFLKGFGINIEAIVQRNKGNLKGLVVEFAQSLDQLDPLNRARAIEQLFGKFQFSRLSTLFQNVIKDGSQAATVLDLAGKSTEELAILAERELGAVEDSMGVKFTAAVEKMQAALAPVGEQFLKILTPIVDFITGLLDRFNGLSDGVKSTITTIITVVGGIAPVALMAFGLVANGIANAIKFILKLKDGYYALTGQSKILGLQTNYMTSEQIEAQTVAASLDQAHSNLTQVFTIEASAVDKLRQAYEQANIAGRNFASANPGAFLPPKVAPRKFNKGGMVGNVFKYASGAFSVPGKGNQDTVPALLTPGEAVIPKEMAKKYAPFIEAMIAGNLPGYNGGMAAILARPSIQGNVTPQQQTELLELEKVLQDFQTTNVSGRVKTPAATLGVVLKDIFASKIITDQKEREQFVNDVIDIAREATQTAQQETINAAEFKGLFEEKRGRLGATGEAKLQQKEFTHIGSGINVMTPRQALSGEMVDVRGEGRIAKLQKVATISDIFEQEHGFNPINIRAKSKLGITSTAEINRKMAGSGADLNKLIADAAMRGSEKFKQMAESTQKGSYESMKQYWDLLDSVMQKKLQDLAAAGKTNIVDSQAEFDQLSPEVQSKTVIMEEVFQDSINEVATQTEELARIQRETGVSVQQFADVIDSAAKQIAEFRGGITSGTSGMPKEEIREKLIEIGNRPDVNIDTSDLLENSYLATQNDARISGSSGAQGTIATIVDQKDIDVAKLRGVQLGDALTQGVKEGIVQNQEEIDAAMTNVVDSGITAGEVEAEVKSPSRRTKRTGNDIADGLILGMTDKLDEVTNAGATLGDAAAGAASTPSQMAFPKASMQSAMSLYGKDPSQVTAIDKSFRRQLQKLQQEEILIKKRLVNASNKEAVGQELLNNKLSQINAQRQYILNNVKNSAVREKLLADLAQQELAIKNAQLATQKQTLGAKLREKIASFRNATAEERKFAMAQMGARVGGAAAAASSVAMMASMVGGPAGEIANKIMGPLMALSMIGPMIPMLMNPWVLAGVALAAFAGSLWYLNNKQKEQAEAISRNVDATNATTEKMKAIGEITGKVGASEIMARRRKDQTGFNMYGDKTDRKGRQFGTKFVESEVGKGIVDSFVQNMKDRGAGEAATMLATELSAYVADGVLTAEQATSIADQIGRDLNNMSVSAQIRGQLTTIIGPNGERLEQDPLQVRLDIIESGQGTMSNALQSALDEQKQYIDKFSQGDFGAAIQSVFDQGLMDRFAFISAQSAQNIELAQAQLDSLKLQNDEQLKQLNIQLQNATTAEQRKQIEEQILKLKEKSASQEQAIRDEMQNTLKTTLKAFNAAQAQSNQLLPGGGAVTAFFDSLEDQVRNKWKDSPLGLFLDEALGKTSKLQETLTNIDGKKAQKIEVTLNTMMASGIIDPQAVTNLLNTFGEDGKALNKVLNLGVKTHGMDKIGQLTNLLGGFKNKKLAKDLLVGISQKNPEEFDQIASSITLIQELAGKDISLEVILKTKKNALKFLEQLASRLQQIEELPDPLTKKAVLNVLTKEQGAAMESVKGFWDYIKSLPDNIEKNAVQNFVSVYRTITEDQIDAEIASRVKSAGIGGGYVLDLYKSQEGRNKLAAEMAAEATKIKFGDGTKDGGGGTKDKGTKDGGAGAGDDMLSELLNRLKQVRDATISATLSWKELQKLVAKPGKVGKFEGIEQQLTRRGYSEDFVNQISGMDPKQRAKFMKVTKKGKVVLSDKGRTLRDTLDELSAGDFSVAQERVVADVKNTTIAMNKLMGAGMSAADAYKILEDKTLAAAIAGKQLTDKELKAIKKAADEAALAMAKIQIDEETADLEKRMKLPSLVARAQLELGGLTPDQVNTILNSEALQLILDQPVVDKEKLQQALDNAAKDAELQIQIKMLTPEGRNELVQAGISAANQTFDAYEKIAQSGVNIDDLGAITENMDQTTIDALKAMQSAYKEVEAQNEAIDKYNKLIEAEQEKMQDAQDQVDAIQETIDDMNREMEINFDRPIQAYQEQISDLQRDIEMQFTRPIEVLQEQINDLQRQTELQFDRPIKALQEESTRLANDLTLLDKAAESINEKYDKQEEALNKIAEINNELIAQEKTRISLADALTQGDISAAAQAAQDLRAQSAQFAQGQQSGMLAAARQLELDSLRSASGMTREQIEERQFQIGQETFALEQQKLAVDKQILAIQDRIYDLQEQQEAKQAQIRAIQDVIYNLEEQKEDVILRIRDLEDQIYQINEDVIEPIQAQIDKYQDIVDKATAARDAAQEHYDAINDSITVGGLTKDAWVEIEAKAALAVTQSKKFKDDMQAALDAMKAIIALGPDAVLPPSGGDGGGGSGGSTGVPGGNEVPTTGLPDDVASAVMEQIEPYTHVQTIKIKYKDGTEKLAYWDLDTNKWVKSPYDETDATWDPGFKPNYSAMGGMINYMANGGMKPFGSDTVPTMLTPGEFVMRKKIVDKFGSGFFNDLNSGNFRSPLSKIIPPYQPPRFDDMQPRYRTDRIESKPVAPNNKTVYNSYSVNVETGNGNPNDIARAVITQIKAIDNQQIRSQRV